MYFAFIARGCCWGGCDNGLHCSKTKCGQKRKVRKKWRLLVPKLEAVCVWNATPVGHHQVVGRTLHLKERGSPNKEGSQKILDLSCQRVHFNAIQHRKIKTKRFSGYTSSTECAPLRFIFKLFKRLLSTKFDVFNVLMFQEDETAKA